MLTTLIRRELLDNLMTFRFAAATFIMLLLVVANTFVLITDYERRLADYNTAVKTHQQQMQERKTYSASKVLVDRPPNPLSLFNVGLDKQLGNQVEVYHGFVPTLWDAEMHGSDNPIMNIFSSIDIVFIFKVVLSLLALIFAYDALAGEHEQGTLRLVLTHSVRRGHILIAKYISAMLCLLVPLIMSLLLAVILLTASTSIFLSTDDFLRIGGIVFSSIVYLSVFYLIGLLISSITRRTSTALMLSMFVWGFLVLVYPNVILAAFGPQDTSKSHRISLFNQIEQLWDEFDRERIQYLKNDSEPGEDSGYGMNWGGWSMRSLRKDPSRLLSYYRRVVHIEDLNEKSEPKVPLAQNYYRFLVPLTIDIADQTWNIRQSVLEELFVQPATVNRTLLRLSPVGLYDAATQAYAGTDLHGVRDFFEAARQYRQQVVDHYYNKKVFEIRQWFAGDKGAAEWDSLPKFSFQRSDININAKRAFLDICLLLMINVVLFIIIFLIFIKSEV
jgi:ABC-type transport system involved in multi-copper enzyme maturation permease subunit